MSRNKFMQLPAIAIVFVSSTIWSNSFAQTTDDNSTGADVQIEYVNFLDVLPNALELDEGIKLAEYGKLAAVESAKAAWSAW